MKTLRLFWISWIVVTGPLKILNWRSEMLWMPKAEKKNKKNTRLFKSDGPWRCLHWLVLQRENLLMLTAVLLWCQQLPFEWCNDSERRPAFGKEPLLYTSLQTQSGVRSQSPPSVFRYLKKIANKWSRTAAGKSKTSTMLPLFIDDKYRWNVFILLVVFLSFRGFLFNKWIFQFLPNQLTRS